MRIKLIFLEQNIARFTSFLSLIQKNCSNGAKGVIMTISNQRITVIYDYNDLTTDMQVIDFSNADNIDNFAYAYFYYDLILMPTDKKLKTIDEIHLFNGEVNHIPIEEVTIRFSLEHLKEIMALANDKNSKSLSIKAINNPNKSEFFKTLFDVHVVMGDKIEKTATFPFRSRINSVQLKEINYGIELIELNHLLSILKAVIYKASKKGLKLILLHFKKAGNQYHLIYEFDRKSFKSLIFNQEDVACYSGEDTVRKTYAIMPNSLSKLFPGVTTEDYLFNEEMFLSNEFLTMKLSSAGINKESTEGSEVYSQAIISIRIMVLTDEEVMELNSINNSDNDNEDDNVNDDNNNNDIDLDEDEDENDD